MNDASTSIPRPSGPVRWKLWLLVVCTLYPIITIAVTAAEPLLAGLPTYARFAIIVPVMVAVMLWVVIPLLQRFFGRWLMR